MLPALRSSSSTFGAVHHDIAPALAGVPITGVLGDQQAALFGQACFVPGLVKATYGTGAFVFAHAGERGPAVVEGLLTTVAWDLGGERAYALEGSAFVAGAAVQWLVEIGVIESAGDLEELARTASDAGRRAVRAGLHRPRLSLLAQPRRAGRSRSQPRRRESASSRAPSSESLAFQVRAMTEAFVAGGVALRELRCDGGASAMDLLLQLQATNSRVSVCDARHPRSDRSRGRQHRRARRRCLRLPRGSGGTLAPRRRASSPSEPHRGRRRLRRLARALERA